MKKLAIAATVTMCATLVAAQTNMSHLDQSSNMTVQVIDAISRANGISVPVNPYAPIIASGLTMIQTLAACIFGWLGHRHACPQSPRQ